MLHSAYQEIQNPPERYGIIDIAELMALCGTADLKRFQYDYQEWVDTALKENARIREGVWTESIAVGSLSYVEGIKAKLGTKAKGRDTLSNGKRYMLKEPNVAYNSHFRLEMGILRTENAYFWNEYASKSIG